MGRVVVVAMRPKGGCAERLRALVVSHIDVLRAENLVTDRDPIVMVAADNTVIEVFEWRSAEAIEAAHSNAAVGKMWGEFAEVCDFVPAGEVEEFGALFSEFSPA